ncbi:porin family protein [Emticicia sp.]|uniref:porin family protein n=1 Tax=Emticicia sp. TaxID=1930953 RepID=UPI0037510F7D
MFKTLALVFITNLTFAQIFVGVRGGVTGSTMTKFALLEKYTPDFKLLPAPTGAIFAEINLSDRFSIQPELAFTQKGFTIQESFDVGGDNALGINIPLGGKVSLKNNHLELPILAKIKLGDPDAVHAYIMVGPSVGYLFGSRAVISILNIFPIRTSLGTGLFHRAEFSGVVALGYEIPFNNGKFFMEGRYQHGISRVLDVPIFQLPVRNQTVGFSAGVSFALNTRVKRV